MNQQSESSKRAASPTNHAPTDHAQTIQALAHSGRLAQKHLAKMDAEQKSRCVRRAADALREARAEILAANKKDYMAAQQAGLSPAMLDRLFLDEARLNAIADGVDMVAKLADPVGQIIDQSSPPNGLALSRVRVPIGLLGVIYESRPNVTADCAALSIKAGNAVLLRGGSEAVHSNRAIHSAFVSGIMLEGMPKEAVQLVASQERELVGAMLEAAGLIDMIIPRGGKNLVERVQKQARVPVLAHLDGICHSYIHSSADPEMACNIAYNAKMRRPGICGAMETLLIDTQFTASQRLISRLIEGGCLLRGDARACALDNRVEAVTEHDWDSEYLDAILSVAIVDGLEDALAHIARHSSGHTEAIVASDNEVAERFLAEVDSAIVMHNASSQFADGGEFGLGAEIGIATGRLHARGPVALEGLTTYKWCDARQRADKGLMMFGPVLSDLDIAEAGGVTHSGAAPKRIGLLGGSFNPAHGGHRRISKFALDALGLDEIWWMVSPGNPLKPNKGMGPLTKRVLSARAQARRAKIRVTAIEQNLGTRYTADTLKKLRGLYPKYEFVWMMGADNLAQFHLWRSWREIARIMPIAVIARPGYNRQAIGSPAMAWLRRYRVTPAQLSDKGRWNVPKLVILRFDPDKRSASAIRLADPQWMNQFSDIAPRDQITRNLIRNSGDHHPKP